MRVKENFSLRSLNTFGVEARARYHVVLERPEDIGTWREDRRFEALPHLILGAGSNLLFIDDYPGVVVQLGWNGWSVLESDTEAIWIQAQAGQNWPELVNETIDAGYAGLENLSLIPGTVGAAPVQNIGAYGIELKECFHSLEAVDQRTGARRRFDRAACAFAYRDSIFKHEAADRWLITSVVLRLPARAEWRIDYAGLREQLSKSGNPPLSARSISDAVCTLRRSKLPDPAQIGNAGSFFKNPVVTETLAAEIRERYPNLPAFPEAKGLVKLSAAWLIEQCGWKGFREGDAGVSPHHALVLVNYGNASGAMLWRLAKRIGDSVLQRFGVALQPELRLIA